MHQHSIRKWQHAHIFGQDIIRAGEKRTQNVILITALMMVIEIISCCKSSKEFRQKSLKNKKDNIN
jgi:hypothetical protein